MYDFIGMYRFIKERREALKMSRELLAKYCDLSDRSLGNIESGKSNPGVFTIAGMFDEINVDVGIINEFYIKPEITRIK